jgi:hypothetical protein
MAQRRRINKPDEFAAPRRPTGSDLALTRPQRLEQVAALALNRRKRAPLGLLLIEAAVKHELKCEAKSSHV